MMKPRRPYIAIVLALGSGLLTIAAAVLLLMSSPSVSQALPLDEEASNPCGDEFQISTIPHIPTQDEPVTITYSAVWYSLPTPMHQALGIADHSIRLDAVYYVPEFFMPVVVTWGKEANFGHLPTGTYTVDVYLTRVVTPTIFPAELCGTSSFTVYEQILETYLPIITK